MSGLHLLAGNGASSTTTGPVPNKESGGGKRASLGVSVASSFMAAMEIDDLRKIIMMKEEELPAQTRSGPLVFRGFMRQISASVLRKEGMGTYSSPSPDDANGESWRSEEKEGRREYRARPTCPRLIVGEGTDELDVPRRRRWGGRGRGGSVTGLRGAGSRRRGQARRRSTPPAPEQTQGVFSASHGPGQGCALLGL